MFVVHFFKNKTNVLTQFRKSVPTEGEVIKIKGQKGKVEKVNQNEENHVYVYVVFEKVVKNKLNALDKKKNRR